MNLYTSNLTGILLVVTLAGTATAQQSPPAQRDTFPISFDGLPPGQLRRDLSRLPPQVQNRAIEKLNSFNVPNNDFEHIRIDKKGGIYYVDGPASADANAVDAVDTGAFDRVAGDLSSAEVFSLHSNPGASNVMFIDVDGHVISGSALNVGNVDPLYATAFDTDGDANSFSAVEIDQIAEIWHRIAEDFSAFDIDVTTEDPLSEATNIGRILITPNVDAYGNSMPSSFASGVAYVGVFGTDSFPLYSPALVYSNNVGNFPPDIAEAASHEAGHNLGLSHDGTSSSSYYTGHGSGVVSWGPIMGSNFNDNVSQWSQGEYADANNFQDDIQIIADVLGMRADDHADLPTGATPLVVDADGIISATTPQNDPFGSQSGNKGIINTRTDTDWFAFSAADGPAQLLVTPSWVAWTRNSGGRGANLDIELTLVDESGNEIAWAEPTNETSTQLDVTLAAGYYYLGITGVGNTISPYSDYSSQGQYFINGQITPGGVEPPTADNTAPTPNPMSFAVLPEALDQTSITMTAATATDNSGDAVEYLFHSDTGGNSGWISSTSYTATNLAPGTNYYWQVMARDVVGNATAFSPSTSATTDDAPTTSEPPSAVSELAVADNADGTATLEWTEVSGATSYEVYRETWHSKRKNWRSMTLITTVTNDTAIFSDASGTGDYRYFVRSVNEAGSADSSWIVVTVTGSSGNGGGGCKGGPKKCS